MAAQRLGIETDGALNKVRRVLPDRLRLGVESLEHTLGFTGRIEPEPPDGETLLTLADAARRARKLTARYTDSAGATTERELTPWGVVAHGGRWYVAAFDHPRDDPRTLRADRIGAVKPAGPGTKAPDGFDATDFVSRSLASVPWAARGRGPPAHRRGHRRPALPAHARGARTDRRRHPPATARRLARLGRRPAGRRGVRVHDPPPARAARQRPSPGRAARRGLSDAVLLRHLLHRVDGAEEGPAFFAGVLDLLGRQVAPQTAQVRAMVSSRVCSSRSMSGR